MNGSATAGRRRCAAIVQVATHGRVEQTIGVLNNTSVIARILAGTVAILAQGTSWAVAVTQAFFAWVRARAHAC